MPTVFSLNSQSLVFNFSQHDNIRAAAAGLAAAKFALKDMREQVEEDVAVTYLNLESDQRALAVMAKEHGDAYAAGDDRSGRGWMRDRMTGWTCSRRSGQATQIELNELNLQDEIAVLSDHLSRMIGLPDDRLTAIPDSIPALPTVQVAADSGNERTALGCEAAMNARRASKSIPSA